MFAKFSLQNNSSVISSDLLNFIELHVRFETYWCKLPQNQNLGYMSIYSYVCALSFLLFVIILNQNKISNPCFSLRQCIFNQNFDFNWKISFYLATTFVLAPRKNAWKWHLKKNWIMCVISLRLCVFSHIFQLC